ncbi:uncharacterized protein TNCV_1104731 [Trichonephila clavipes]|nr:uncharacterized protein TNCV_1104731 [Trichonephila clavipes]
MIKKYGAIENAAIDNMFQCMDFLTAYKTFCEGPIENTLPSSLDVSLGTQTVIQDGQWKQFHPLSNVLDNAPVEFHISGSAEDYIDLSQTQLYVKAKIVKVDNTPITKDDTIRPVNLFLHSLFSQVDVSLNDRVVSNSSNTYPYLSYIETLLNHGYDSKTSQLTAELFYKDSDDGLKKRTEFLKKVQLLT